MATRCKFRGRRGILWDVLKIDGSIARNIDFEVANFVVHKKTRGKRRFWSYTVWGSLARNARFDAPTCLVSSLWFSSGLAVSIGEVAKPVLVHRVKASCNVVLRGRRGASWHSHVSANVLCGTRNTSASFLEDELHFSWQAWHFGDLHRHFALQAQHFGCVALRVSCESQCHTTLYPPHFAPYTLHSTLYTPHFALYTPHFTLRTPQFTLYTPHSRLYTPHFTLYTPHFTLYTLHFTLHTLHSTLFTLHFALHSLRFSLHTPHSALYTPHFALHPLPRSTRQQGKHVQDCSNNLFHKSARVRGLHLVFGKCI